jgi:photosystem II stability/assembly factor-like uncharacterized protein
MEGAAMSNASYVYAGAAPSLFTNASDQCAGGIVRRAVGDDHWERVESGLPERPEVHAIALDPRDPETVYVGTQDGPYRSTDRGKRWERLGFPDAGTEIWSILFDPLDPRRMYAGGAPSVIYRSEDGGDHWRRMRVDRPEWVRAAFATRVMRLAADTHHPGEMYAGLEVGGVVRSTDGGETWTDASAPLAALAEQPHLRSRIVSDTDIEGMMDAHALAVSGAAPRTVFLAVRMGLFRSTDGGTTWQDLEVGRFSPLTYARDVRVWPHDPDVLFACLSPAARSEDGSLYRSGDRGATWKRFDHGVKATSTMMAMALHPRDPAQVYCASRHGQVFGTRDGGRTWDEHPLPPGFRDVYAVACG